MNPEPRRVSAHLLEGRPWDVAVAAHLTIFAAVREPEKATRPCCRASCSPLHLALVRRFHFIEPCSPVAGEAVPAGPDWLHEVKFDGYRVQIQKAGKDIVIFSRNGHDFTSRFDTIAYLLRDLPAKFITLDCEIVASNAAGVPDFIQLHRRVVRPDALHLWCFDLLALNGRDWRPYALLKRQARLDVLLARFDCPAVLMSKAFDDGAALLRAAHSYRLEGIVSKKREAPYRSGPCRDWVKVKTSTWTAGNRDRGALFGEKPRV